MDAINIKRWDDFSSVFTFTDTCTWDVIDLTSSTVYLTVRSYNTLDSSDDNDAVISITQTTHTDPTNWKTIIDIPRATTDVITPWGYFYDIQILLADNKKISTETWDFNLIQDITKS